MHTVKTREVHSPRHTAYDVLCGTQVIATCDTWPDNDEIMEANARAIAAALDLVEGGAVDKAREALVNIDAWTTAYQHNPGHYPVGEFLKNIKSEAIAALGGEVGHG